MHIMKTWISSINIPLVIFDSNIYLNGGSEGMRRDGKGWVGTRRDVKGWEGTWRDEKGREGTRRDETGRDGMERDRTGRDLLTWYVWWTLVFPWAKADGIQMLIRDRVFTETSRGPNSSKLNESSWLESLGSCRVKIKICEKKKMYGINNKIWKI